MGTVLFHLVHRQHNSKTMTSYFSGLAELGGRGGISGKTEVNNNKSYIKCSVQQNEIAVS